MAGTNQFLVIGHSSEEYVSYNNRPKIPEGCTLLVFAQCDMTTKTEDIEKAIELASQVPLDTSKFRIYKEDDPYPPLNLQLFSDFEIPLVNKSPLWALLRSGVYKVPIDLEDFQSYEDFITRHWMLNSNTKTSYYSAYGKKLTIPDSEKRFKTYKKSVVLTDENPQKDFIEFQFSQSIFPPKATLTKILDESKTVEEIREKLKIPLSKLFQILGPGLYIVPSCRSAEVDLGDDEQDLFNYIDKEIYDDLADRLTLYHNRNRLAYRKQKLNLLNGLQDNPKLQEEPWKTKYLKVREELRSVVRQIENTRSKSRGRQRGVGGARKTRRSRRNESRRRL